MILWVFVIYPPPIISSHICLYYLHPAPLELNNLFIKYHKKRWLPLHSDSLPGKKEIASLPVLTHPAIHICPQAEQSSPTHLKQVHNTSSVTSGVPLPPLPCASVSPSHSRLCVVSPPPPQPPLFFRVSWAPLLCSHLPCQLYTYCSAPPQVQPRAGSASSPCYIPHSLVPFCPFVWCFH